MELTKTQKTLAYGLKQFPISEENLKGVFLFLHQDEAKMKEMIKYLVQNKNAKEQDILNEMGRILKT